MLKKGGTFKSIDILFSLTLFSVFAMAVLMVLLSGGQIYQNVVNDISIQFESRTSVSYITTKLRRCDTNDSVRVEMFGDAEALFLTEVAADGKEYETVIYLHEGDVKEQFTEKGNHFPPSTGTTILSVQSINFSMVDNSLVVIDYTTDEGAYTAYVYLRVNGGNT
ncbi:MAG: DUF4860 domain-containing protein [Oscillospiraceae bacterium]|nr:DUF4860 domain-containing protein [Oscillospiraceae bacterium]